MHCVLLRPPNPNTHLNEPVGHHLAFLTSSLQESSSVTPHESVREHLFYPHASLGLTRGKLDVLQESAHRWLDKFLSLRHVNKTDKRKLSKLMNLEQISSEKLKSKAVEQLRTRLAHNLQLRHDLRDNCGFQVLPLGKNLRALVARRDQQRVSLLNLQAQALNPRKPARKSPDFFTPLSFLIKEGKGTCTCLPPRVGFRLKTRTSQCRPKPWTPTGEPWNSQRKEQGSLRCTL